MSAWRAPETTVLEVGHRDDCFAMKSERDGFPWCYVPGFRGEPATVHRDRRGRKAKYENHSFLVLLCLDPTCPARLLVSERAFATWATDEAARRTAELGGA